MSRIIRAVRGPWLAPPSDSTDAHIPAYANTYELAQLAIEASERLHQSQVNRTIRAGRMAAPLPATSVRSIPAPAPNFIINMPVN